MKGSVTKKGNRWYPRYYIGQDENGKWIQKWGKGCDSKKDAERQLRRYIEQVENSFERKVDKSTVSEFLRHWLKAYCEPRLAQNTIRGYRTNIEKHIIPYIGKTQLSSLTPRDIQKLYSQLASNGLSGTSIRYVHNNLHRALEYAVKQEIIYRNPASLVDPPKINRYESTPLSSNDAQRLLTAAKGSELYAPITLAVTLGLRRGEVLGLQWCDVDFVHNTITINHSGNYENGKMVLSSPKTKQSRRTLRMPDLLREALLVTQQKQNEIAMFVGEGFNPQNVVCCRADGSILDIHSLHRKFKALLEYHRIPDIRFHDLRHTYATLMLKDAVPAKIVQNALGHSSIGITMDTYSHVISEMQDIAADATNSIFASCK